MKTVTFSLALACALAASTAFAHHPPASLGTVRITQPVQANAVFAILPPEVIAPLKQQFPFYVWNEDLSEVRWMTTFDTTAEDVEAFVHCLQDLLPS